MVVGGVWSLVKLLKPLSEGIKSSLSTLKNDSSDKDIPLEEQDMPINYVGIALAAFTVPVFLLYLGIVESIPVAASVSYTHLTLPTKRIV